MAQPAVNKAFLNWLKPMLTDNAFLGQRPLAAALLSLAVIAYGALGAVEADAAEKVRYLLLLGSVWIFVVAPKALRRSPAFWLFAAAALVSLLSWALSLLTHPQWAESSPKLDRTANWLAAIAIATALGGHLQRGLLVWGLAAVALLLAPWLSGDGWAEIWRGLNGQRVDFKLHNAEHAGLYFSVLGLGLLALLPRAFRLRRGRGVALLIWIIALAGAITGIVITQTRSMWLGFTAALMLLGWLQGLRLSRHRLWRWISAVLLSLAMVPLLVVFARLDIVETRSAAEESTVQSLLSGRFGDIPFDSAGIRIHSWLEGLDWFAARPLLGWGGRGRNLVISESQWFTPEIKQTYRHLHNSYLDVAVNYGVVGLALLLLMWFWFVRIALQAARRGHLPTDLLHFFLCFMVLWAVVNFFESFVFYTSGIYVFSLIGGLILSCHWRSTLQTGTPHPDLESSRR